jgi:hypothetical protein
MFMGFGITFGQFLLTWTAFYLPFPTGASYSPPCLPLVSVTKLHHQAAGFDA